MTKKEMVMTEGSLWKKIFIFSLPLILSNILQVLFNMSDIAVIGNFAGDIALGSVGSCSTLVLLFTGFLIGMGNGVNVVIAKSIGLKDEKEIKNGIHTSFILCLIVGFIIMGLGMGLSRPILYILNTKDELIDGAILYTSLYFIGMPAMAIYNWGNGIYSAKGNTKVPLIFLAIAGVINICLNLFFVIVLKLDVAGVAMATFISQYISAALIVISLIYTNDYSKFSFRELKINKNKAKDILMLGIPSGLQNAIFAIANLFIQSGVNTFDHIMVSGNSAAMNADSLIYDVMTAFYTACATFMSQNLGAGKKNRILKSYFISLLYSFLIAFILGYGLVLFGRPFLHIFSNSEEVIDAGMKRLTIMGFSYCVSAFMDCTIAASRGLGKSLIPTIIVIMGSCVLRIIWVYTIFSYYKTFQALYLVYVSSWIITSFFEIIYFVYIYKKSMKKFFPEEVKA
mgnify:FL=1